jgi:hypothetical protein
MHGGHQKTPYHKVPPTDLRSGMGKGGRNGVLTMCIAVRRVTQFRAPQTHLADRVDSEPVGRRKSSRGPDLTTRKTQGACAAHPLIAKQSIRATES